MFNKSKYGKILKVILIIVVIAIIGIIAITGYKMYNAYYINTGALETVKKFEDIIKNNSTEEIIKYKEFSVVGIIEIPDIDLKYPILESNNKDALKISPVLLYTAQGLNNDGNSVITGYNKKDNTIFSNLNKLTNKDDIYITDHTGKKQKYEIYNVSTVQEGDNSYITRKLEYKKEISLSTTTNDGKEKLIILAREK